MTLDVRVHTPHIGFQHALTAAAEATLQYLDVVDASVVVVTEDVKTVQAMNRDYRGLDEPTDVLSFPDGEVDPESGLRYLGDVIVCPWIANAGAALGGHSLTDELCMLVVHGVLHLLDYDHDTTENEIEMWAAQARILERLGRAEDVAPD